MIDGDTWGQRFRRFLEESGTWDEAHDVAHVERVVNTALCLAELERAEYGVVFPAAWLHDCVRIPKNHPERPRASRLAAKRAAVYLEEAGYDAAPLAEIAHAIEAHSFSAGIPARTIEARVVQDADRLDALGAIGIARCVAVGAALNRPLYHSGDPFCQRRSPDDRVATLDHFFTKLLTLEETMQTAAGRSEARRRTAFLRDFLAQLESEIG